MRLINLDELLDDLNAYASGKGIKGHKVATDCIKVVNNQHVIILPDQAQALKHQREVEKLWQKVIKEDDKRSKTNNYSEARHET